MSGKTKFLRKVAFGLVAGCSCFALCQKGVGADSTGAWRGTRCGVKVATSLVISSQEDWEKLWKKIPSESPPPAIDFEKNSVVAVFSGEKPTAGYSVEIKKVKETAQGLQIIFQEKKPAKDRMVAQVLTQPYAAQIIPRPFKGKKVLFIRKS